MRMQNLEVSENAKSIIHEVCAIKDALEKSVFDGITEEEIETMKEVFRKICTNINGIVG